MPAAVVIRELNPDATVRAGEEWQRLAEAQGSSGRERIYGEVFGDLWPRVTPRWWEDWKGLPLSPEESYPDRYIDSGVTVDVTELEHVEDEV